MRMSKNAHLQSGVEAYRLLRPVAGCKDGTIWVADRSEYPHKLVLAWTEEGNCQDCGPNKWVGGAYTMPIQVADDKEWFARVEWCPICGTRLSQKEAE